MKLNLPELNMFEKILSKILRRYTIKVYRQGFQDGLNLKNQTIDFW